MNKKVCKLSVSTNRKMHTIIIFVRNFRKSPLVETLNKKTSFHLFNLYNECYFDFDEYLFL